MSTSHAQPPRQSDRAFGLMFGVFLGIISTVAYFVFDARLDWLIAAAFAFIVTALIAAWILLPLNRLWGRFAQLLGYINNHLILGLFYYLILFPIGVIIRLARRDPMNRKIDRLATSYWTDVGRTAKADNFIDMF